MLTWKRKLALSAGFVATLALFVAVMVLAPRPAMWEPVARAAAIEKTVQTVSTTVITPTRNTITSTDGIKLDNNGQMIVLITNNYTDTVWVTLTVPYEPISGLDLVSDLSIELSAGEDRAWGPFVPTYFNPTSGTNKGQIVLKASDTASVTVAALTW